MDRKQTLSFVTAMPSLQEWASAPTRDEAPEKLAAFPSLRRAAEIIGVDPATLSRRKDIVDRIEPRGRERLFPPALTLELAAYYRKRRLTAVASDLIDLAVEDAPDYVDEIEHEVDETLGQLTRQPRQSQAVAFLAEARRSLPPDLFAQVENAYEAHLPVSGGTAYLGDEED